MRIIAVDDEMLALENIEEVLKEVFVDDNGKSLGEIRTFMKYKESLEYCDEMVEKGEKIEYAFLDIKMRGLLGIELAKMLKEKQPDIKVIFVTGYKEYSFDAFQIHASGYICKPATKEQVESTLEGINRDWRSVKADTDIIIKTFGNFDVYVNNASVEFKRAKSKEMLAYLIDRRGTGVTAGELCAVLYEDKEYNFSLQRQFQTVVSELVKSLKAVNAEEILVRKRNYYAINTELVKCDYYDYLKGDVLAVNSYQGEYMSQYSWAELTLVNLSNMHEKL